MSVTLQCKVYSPSEKMALKAAITLANKKPGGSVSAKWKGNDLVCTTHSQEQTEAMMYGLMVASYLQLRGMPSLYGSGVRYLKEPPGQEIWQTAKQTLSKGYGDCEDLATWRAAELRVSGLDSRARPVLYQSRPGVLHAVVRRGNGTIEDPSAKLGMGVA